MIKKKPKVKSILITQPKPESEKNPYAELAKKFNLKVDFRSFVHVEGISAKEFRKEKINLKDYTAVIFTSKQSIDHFFRLCEELRFEVSAEMKYICNIESIALYLQKYIQYRKRKVFVGKNNSASEIMELIKKNPSEKYLYPGSDNGTKKDELPDRMRKEGYCVSEAVIYRTVCSDLSNFSHKDYDIIALFTPHSVESLLKNFPSFEQKDVKIATFGNTTHQAIAEAGFISDIQAPTPQVLSMPMAIEEYLKGI